MPESTGDETAGRPPAPQTEANVEFDLPAEIDRLYADVRGGTGHHVRTLVKYDDFRIVLIALVDQARLPEHKAAGRISIHALSGHVQVTAAGRTFSLRPGGLVTLEHGVRHDVRALEDSAFLLTMAGSRKA